MASGRNGGGGDDDYIEEQSNGGDGGGGGDEIGDGGGEGGRGNEGQRGGEDKTMTSTSQDYGPFPFRVSTMATYLIPGENVDREVITTDICQYLGCDALVLSGIYKV